MPSYPAYDQHQDTRVTPLGGVKVQIAPNSIVGAQARAAATTYRIFCVHDRLTLTERDAIIAFYAAHAREKFSWTAAESAQTYANAVFEGANAVAWSVKRVVRETRFRVEVRLLTSA